MYNFGEGGLGYYKTFNNDLQLGIYSGYGIGYAKGENIGVEGDVNDEGFYNRLFIQTIIGNVKDKKELSFSLRIAYFWEYPYQKYDIHYGMDNYYFDPVFTYKYYIQLSRLCLLESKSFLLVVSEFFV